MKQDDLSTIPYVVDVSNAAKQCYIEWFNRIALEAQVSFEGKASEALLLKLRSQTLRIVLLLHSLDAALYKEEGLHPICIDTMKNGLLLAEWIKENQFQTWKLIETSVPKVRIGTVLDRVMIETIVELESELKNNDWKITNECLFKRISQKMSTAIEPRILGKVAAGLGLSSIWIGNKRGKQISSEKFASLKMHVRHVGHVGCPSMATALDDQQEKKVILDMLEVDTQESVFTNKTNKRYEECWDQDSLDTQGLPTRTTLDFTESIDLLLDEVEI